jgi:hypothetical protein
MAFQPKRGDNLSKRTRQVAHRLGPLVHRRAAKAGNLQGDDSELLRQQIVQQ